MRERQRQLIATTTRAAVIISLLLFGLVVFWWLLWTQPEPTQRGEDVGRAEVLVFQAAPVAVSRQWQGYGTAAARDAANVPARVGATVVRVPDDVEAGYRVEAGQLLVELDPSDFEQDLEAAEQRIAELDAQLAGLEVQQQRLAERLELERRDVETARRELERAQRLYQREVMTQQEVDRAEREWLAAQRSYVTTHEAVDQIPARRRGLEAQRGAQRSALARARLNLERTRITSPIAGVIDAVNVQAGENVVPGQSVARVVSLERIEVPLRLPASARAGVRTGDAVELHATDGSAMRWAGHVGRVAPSDDAQSRTVTVYVELDQQMPAADEDDEEAVGLLAPGMFVRGLVDSQRTEHRWVVPRRAIRDGAIRTIEDGQVVSRRVEIAWSFEGRVDALGLPDDRQWAALRDELSEGQLIMASAASAVLDGQRVVPIVARER